jgi:hypothetical protein
MPDQYGFNHLGDEVRCIDCPSGGPLWQWPEHKRARHGRSHGHAPKAVSTDLRRQRSLLAAPPTRSNEEKEATMATAKRGGSAKQVAIDVLRKADQLLRASEIAKRLLASGRCAGLKGKTPEATISAMRRLQARRPVRSRRQGHLHPRQQHSHEQGRRGEAADDREASCDAQPGHGEVEAGREAVTGEAHDREARARARANSVAPPPAGAAGAAPDRRP